MSDVVASLTWLEECFEKNINLAEPNWLREFRAHELKKFVQRGFPTRREELWKYTDTSHLAKKNYCGPTLIDGSPDIDKLSSPSQIKFVFINGIFSETLSDIAKLPKEVTLLSLRQVINDHVDLTKPYLTREFDEKKFPFASLNLVLMTDGVFLKIEKNYEMTTPIHCLFINTKQQNFVSCPRNIILAGDNSSVTLIEEYVGDQAENYFVSALTMIEVNNGAYVEYFKIQDEAASATHIANVFVEQQQDSKVKAHFFSRGGALEREDLCVRQNAKGAEAQLNGFYSLHSDEQHVDHHVHVDHLVPHGISSMIYKGILDKKSHAVFNGKVFVHQDAQQINAHQENHNLLLSNSAEVNTKPELEIYADDVKCTHGATIGQLDNESLFYLRSRGIEESEARKILVHAFSDQIFNTITNREIRDYVQQRVSSHDEL